MRVGWAVEFECTCCDFQFDSSEEIAKHVLSNSMKPLPFLEVIGMAGSNRVSPKLILMFINVGIVLGMILGYRNYQVDKYSMFAIGGVGLLVLDGMYFAIRRFEPDLPPSRLKQMNKWVVWPIVLLAGLLFLIELFSRNN